MLADRFSPEQVAGRLKVEHPEDPQMHVSHETIYQALYVQGRGSLRLEIATALRSGRQHGACNDQMSSPATVPGDGDDL